MKLVNPEVPLVIRQFNEWYVQLSDHDKGTICTHLRHWLKTDGFISQLNSQVQPHFGGRKWGTASNYTVGNQKEEVKCEECGTQIKVVACGNCGNHVEIK